MKKICFVLCLAFATSLVTAQDKVKPAKKKKKKNVPAMVLDTVKTETISEPPAVTAPPRPVSPPVHQGTAGNTQQTSENNALESHSQQLITELPKGNINWSEQYVEARGESVLDTSRFKNTAQARVMATRGAVVVAQRNLLEIIKGVEVTSETTVQDMIASNDYIYTRIDGVIKGAQQVGEAIVKDGLVTVRMRVPLYSQDGLAPALYDQLKAAKDKSMERTAAEENTLPAGTPEVASLENVVFNLAGKKIDPSMFPVIVDQNNNILLDLYKIYNPMTGKFPKILKTTKEMLGDLGIKKGVEVIDVIEASNGKIKINNLGSKKINWAKIGKTAATIGKFLMLLL